MGSVATDPEGRNRTVLEYRPQPKQWSWHACSAYESGFGGAKFGGKSLALLMEGVRYHHHPRYRGIIFRRTHPQLVDLLDRAHVWFPHSGLEAKWDGEERAWVFPAGGRLFLRHCQNEIDKEIYQGHEYQFMGFDQLEQFLQSQYLFLMQANRTGISELVPYLRVTFNPGGIGHGWVKQRFIDHGSTSCAPWEPFNDEGDKLQTRCFHFATWEDNPAGVAADPLYIQRLDALEENERRALKLGDWDVFAGQVFGEWRKQIHVCEPFTVPPEWPRWCGIDYGYHAPSCVLWVAKNPDGVVYVYREIYKTQLRDVVVGNQIRPTISEEKIKNGYADPSIWNVQPNGTSAAKAMNLGGWLRKANNDRLAGWQRVHQFLHHETKQPPISLHEVGGKWAQTKELSVAPKLQVFRTCPNLVRTLPALIYDDHRVEDVDTDIEDHAADALRYVLMGISRPVSRGGQTEFEVDPN